MIESHLSWFGIESGCGNLNVSFDVPNDDLPIMDIAARSQKLAIWMPFDRYNFEAVTFEFGSIFFCVSIIYSDTWIFATFTCGDPPRTWRNCYTANRTLNQTVSEIVVSRPL